MAELRRVAQQDSDYPTPLFFHLGDTRDGDRFFERFWPEARTVADPGGEFYAGFERSRAGLRELLGPGALARSLGAMRRGHFAGAPVGDVRRMPGIFVVEGDEILWAHRFKHIGDHPDFARIPTMLGTSAAAPAADPTQTSE